MNTSYSPPLIDLPRLKIATDIDEDGPVENVQLAHMIAKLHPNHVAQLDRIEEKLDRLLELLSPSP